MSNHEEYEINQNGQKYVLSLDIINNSLVINCCDMNSPNNKGYYVEYFHEQLKQFSPVFTLTKNIYEDFNLFKNSIDNKRVKIVHQGLDIYITFTFETEDNLLNYGKMDANIHLEPNPNNFTNLPSNVEYSTPRYLPTIHVRLPTINIRRPTIYINDANDISYINNIENLTTVKKINQIKNNNQKIDINNFPKNDEKKINHFKTYTQLNNKSKNQFTPQKQNIKNYINNSPILSPNKREQIEINNFGSPSKNKYNYSSYRNQNNKIINNIRRVDSNTSTTSSNEDKEQINRIQSQFKILENEFEKQKLEINNLIKLINELKAENGKLKIENQNLINKENLSGAILNENNTIKIQINNYEKKCNDYEKLINMKEQENETYKKKLEELMNDKINSENEINQLKEELQNIKSQYTKINNKEENLRLVKGEIIENNEELEFLAQKICKEHKKITLNLLYKATIDSPKAASFHKRCDSSESTLVLVKSDKDKRFGGFTTCSWEGECIEKEDENAFVFSLDKMKTYDIIPYEKAIGCYPNFGPIFLGCQIRIYDEAFVKGGSTYLKGSTYYTEEDYELTGGEQQFLVKEIEVYGVILE